LSSLTHTFHTQEALLLINGADINIINKNGGSALVHAVSGRRLDIVRLLVTNGADVNVKVRSLCVLYVACQGRPDYDIIELLLKGGADLYVKHDKLGTLDALALLGENEPIVVKWEKYNKEFLEDQKSGFVRLNKALNLNQYLIEDVSNIAYDYLTLADWVRVVYPKD